MLVFFILSSLSLLRQHSGSRVGYFVDNCNAFENSAILKAGKLLATSGKTKFLKANQDLN